MRASPLRSLAIVVGGAVLAILVSAGTALLIFVFNFHHFATQARYPAPKSALEAQRQDLDYFAKMMAFDRAFTPATRAAAVARLRALESLPQALPSPQLHVALMQVMALADNGHSRMNATADEGTLVLPVRVTLFADGLYVMRATAPHRDLLGARVDSIDGRSVDEVLSRLETLRGGVPGFRRQNAAQDIVVQDLLFGLGVASEAGASTWTVTPRDGHPVTRRLEAYPLKKGHDLPEGDRWLSPDPVTGAETDWIAYRPQQGEVPETWRDPGQAYRFLAGAGSCARLVQLRSIADAGDEKIVPFLAATEAALRAHPPCAVIVDLRGDGGGDYTNTWHFTHALPRLLAPGGHLFVLTDSLTFSAAITTAAFIKDAGGKRVTIIGEPIGDRLAFFAEGGQACLPNLKVCLSYQTGKHDYAHACDDWHVCFWINWLYPVRVASLQPDVLVPLRFEDWNAGRDPAYSLARQIAASSL